MGISLVLLYGAITLLKSNVISEELLSASQNPAEWGSESFIDELIDLYQNLNRYGSFVYVTLFFIGHGLVVSVFRAAINLIVVGFNLSLQSYEAINAEQ